MHDQKYRVACLRSLRIKCSSISSLSSCRRIYEEVTSHRWFQKSFDGLARYTRVRCLSLPQDLEHCWVLTSPNDIVSFSIDDTSENWRPFKHFPNLQTLEIEDTQYGSCRLSLHATGDDATKLPEAKQTECWLLWHDHTLKALRAVIDRNGINIKATTFLTISTGPN